jgi:ADP-ribose pyrophosphatase YjhB (NUDIX family)
MSKKIPEHAKKVFSWIIFDAYQREQKLFDWSYTTFEALKRRNWVIIIPITSTWKIIVIQDEQPNRDLKITVPTWSVDDNEKEIETADRELLEETWYKAKEIEFLWKEESIWQKIDFEIHYFLWLNCEKIAQQKLEWWERIKTFKMWLEEFKEVLENPKFDKYVKNFIEKHNILNKINEIIKKN